MDALQPRDDVLQPGDEKRTCRRRSDGAAARIAGSALHEGSESERRLDRGAFRGPECEPDLEVWTEVSTDVRCTLSRTGKIRPRRPVWRW